MTPGSIPLTGRIGFRREVYFRWEAGEPIRPFMVRFFDRTGRRVLTARLADYRPVALPDAEDGAEPPVMPTDITLEPEVWPPTKLPDGTVVDPTHNPLLRLRIRLSDMRMNKGLPAACIYAPPDGGPVRIEDAVDWPLQPAADGPGDGS